MGADDLAAQGTKASATIILTSLNRDHSVLTRKELIDVMIWISNHTSTVFYGKLLLIHVQLQQEIMQLCVSGHEGVAVLLPGFAISW